ncbi:hypothetical protein BH18ACT17_BH18ACT17_04780 [soil metagenome]
MAAPLTEPSLLGSLLADRYEVRAPLGSGGMGEVFEAVDRVLGRTVAIKVLRPELAADERFLARFRREASMAARLAHVGIVSVHDIAEQAGRTFIVMEFVSGRTIAAITSDDHALEAGRVARIGAAAARALAHAHDRGVVHRDVSPANVMVTADGTVKILDFGIAALMQRSGSADRTALMQRSGSATPSAAGSRGTVAYLAPEVLRGGPVDARADVYALGAVLRELTWVIDEPHDRLDEVLDRATAPEPRARYISAAAFAEALDGVSDRSVSPASQRTLDLSRRSGDLTSPIVRTATRPLGAADAAIPPAMAPVLQPGFAPMVTPVPGVPVPGGRPRRVARAMAILALVVSALGGAIVLGQAFGSMSAPQVATVAGPEPVPAPADLVATASCDGLFSTRVDLTWSGEAPVKGYEISRGSGTDDRALITRVRGVHTDAYRDPELGVDASYAYRIRAFAGLRVSEWSNVAEVDTPFLCLT